MKSIIINDFMDLLFKSRKYIISYFIIVIMMIISLYLFNYNINDEMFSCLVGLRFENFDDPFQVLMFLFNLTFIIFIILYLFIKDIRFGQGNIFLRINVAKWIIYKSISIFICILLIRVTLYVLVILLLNYRISIFFLLRIDLLYFFLIQNLVILIYIISRKNKFISSLFLLMLIYIVFSFKISISVILQYDIIMFLMSVILLIANYKFADYIGACLLERT